jgi:Trypsin.
MRSTFLVSDGNSTGTAFILGKPIANDSAKAEFVFVTAAHVLNGFYGDTAIIQLRTKPKDEYAPISYKFQIRAKAIPKWIQHKTQDVAVMKISLPNVADIKLCQTTFLATDKEFDEYDVVPGEDVMILGFPYGLASNSAIFPILRSGKIASYPITPTSKYQKLLLDFNVFPGNSGGPVFIQSNNRIYGGGTHIGITRMIIGLVSTQIQIPEKINSQDQTTTINHRLGLAEVIPASFIKELIEQLK